MKYQKYVLSHLTKKNTTKLDQFLVKAQIDLKYTKLNIVMNILYTNHNE